MEEYFNAGGDAADDYARQLGRHCRTMEYDPKYCDVIITRWEKYTGRKATKIE